MFGSDKNESKISKLFFWKKKNKNNLDNDIDNKEEIKKSQTNSTEQESNTQHDKSTLDNTNNQETKKDHLANIQSDTPYLNANEKFTKEAPITQDNKQKKESFFSRIKQGLSKTRSNLIDGISNLFLGKKEIDEELLEDLEAQLITADIGIKATEKIISNITDKMNKKELKNVDILLQTLKTELKNIVIPVSKPLEITTTISPFVILVIGVNGVGKTTTIAKLAHHYKNEGKNVMLAAGDTFRAAAVEQLKYWGQKLNIPVISQQKGADSASVIYDAFDAAKARNTNILIADTAGRLHNKDNLMEELKKIVRVLKKLDPNAPHEVLLVLDSGTGQNALSQVELFNKAVPLNGIALTKLDGTAKGGVIFSLSEQFNIPIRFIGVGESYDDLKPFHADQFIDALFIKTETVLSSNK